MPFDELESQSAEKDEKRKGKKTCTIMSTPTIPKDP